MNSVLFHLPISGTSMSMSVTAGVGMDFDALYLTSPEHPFAPIDDAVAAARRRRNVPDNLPAVNAAGGDRSVKIEPCIHHISSFRPSINLYIQRYLFREVMYPAVEAHLQKFGLRGKACLLRAICESQEKPIKHYNFFGELLSHFLRWELSHTISYYLIDIGIKCYLSDRISICMYTYNWVPS